MQTAYTRAPSTVPHFQYEGMVFQSFSLPMHGVHLGPTAGLIFWLIHSVDIRSQDQWRANRPVNLLSVKKNNGHTPSLAFLIPITLLDKERIHFSFCECSRNKEKAILFGQKLQSLHAALSHDTLLVFFPKLILGNDFLAFLIFLLFFASYKHNPCPHLLSGSFSRKFFSLNGLFLLKAMQQGDGFPCFKLACLTKEHNCFDLHTCQSDMRHRRNSD